MSDATILTEVFQSVTRGQNGLLDPLLLPKGQAARLLNVEVRNGLAETRPALLDEGALPVQGRFQGAFVYRREKHTRWVVVVSGQVWVYSHRDKTWAHAATFPTTDFEQAYFCQAESYCVVQNGVYAPAENWPIILDGADVIDNLAVDFISGNEIVTVADYVPAGATDPEPQAFRIPIGKAMAYGQGRLFVAVERFWDNGLATASAPGWRDGKGLRHIVASDDYRADDPQRMFVFTENDLLTGGGALTLPSENGFITSLTFMRNAATGTGVGELVVLSRRGCTAFAVSVPREQWGTAGFGQQLFQTSGSSSPWAVSAVNSDIVYYGDEGIRTLKYTASSETASGGLASLPLSPEVTDFTKNTDPDHVSFVTMASANNYLFFTAESVKLADGSVAFLGVLPWDLANFQVSGEAPNRVFAGEWHGAYFHAVLDIGRYGAGCIYRDDYSGDLKLGRFVGYGRNVPSSVRTPSYVFGAPRHTKRLKYIDLFFDNVASDLEVFVLWRTENSNQWYRSDSRHFKSTYPAPTGMFRVPADADNVGTGHIFEFDISWVGHARLKLAMFNAVAIDAYAGDEDLCEVIDLDEEQL